MRAPGVLCTYWGHYVAPTPGPVLSGASLVRAALARRRKHMPGFSHVPKGGWARAVLFLGGWEESR